MATYFALFMGHIVTANADGSIPMNSKLVLKIDQDQQANEDLVNQLLAQANDYNEGVSV